MKETFAGRVRAALRDLGEGAEVTTAVLSERMEIQEYHDMKRLRNTLSELVKTGEAARVRPGVFEYVGKTRVTKEYLMWRRLRRGATVKDLMIFASASFDYVQEWLRNLTTLGLVVVDEAGVYRLIKDSVEMPKNERKAERLRELRGKKQAALDLLKKAQSAVDEARILIGDIDEGVDDARG